MRGVVRVGFLARIARGPTHRLTSGVTSPLQGDEQWIFALEPLEAGTRPQESNDLFAPWLSGQGSTVLNRFRQAAAQTSSRHRTTWSGLGFTDERFGRVWRGSYSSVREALWWSNAPDSIYLFCDGYLPVQIGRAGEQSEVLHSTALTSSRRRTTWSCLGFRVWCLGFRV